MTDSDICKQHRRNGMHETEQAIRRIMTPKHAEAFRVMRLLREES